MYNHFNNLHSQTFKYFQPTQPDRRVASPLMRQRRLPNQTMESSSSDVREYDLEQEEEEDTGEVIKPHKARLDQVISHLSDLFQFIFFLALFLVVVYLRAVLVLLLLMRIHLMAENFFIENVLS